MCSLREQPTRPRPSFGNKSGGRKSLYKCGAAGCANPRPGNHRSRRWPGASRSRRAGHHLQYRYLWRTPALSPADVRGQGWIPVLAPPATAGVSRTPIHRAGAPGAGKVRISPHATIGLYWFSSFRLYEQLYQRRYRPSAQLDAGERYVAPIYNELIEAGDPVYIQDLPLSAVIPLGVPAEVERFAEASPPDLRRKPEFP